MKKFIFSRMVLAGMALAGMVLVLCLAGACGGTGNVKQELVMGEQFDLQSIDPLDGMLDDTQILVYNGLVEMDSNFKETPALAESWDMSEDGLTWTFHLRHNVKFHDGEPWNSAAAIANFARLAGYPGFADAEIIEAPDEWTVVFKMRKPTYTLSANLARPILSMVSPKAINPDGSLKIEAGSGPYKLANWERDHEYVFEAYDDFWGGKPNIRKITYKVIPDSESRAAALEAGDIDMMSGYQSLGAIKRLANDSRFHLYKKTQNTSAIIIFNINKAPLDQIEVREAIGRAIDFNSIINNLLGGLATAPRGLFSPAYGSIVNPAVGNPEFDVEKSKQLLDAAGWKADKNGLRTKNGKPLSVSLMYGAANSEDSLIAPVIQDYLSKVGIELILNPLESSALDDAQEDKSYDLILAGQDFVPTDDLSFNYRSGYWHSDSYYKVYTSQKLDDMINTLLVTMNDAKRLEMHWAIQKEIMDNLPVLMAYHRNSTRLAKNNVTDFDISAGCWHVNRLLKDAVIR